MLPNFSQAQPSALMTFDDLLASITRITWWALAIYTLLLFFLTLRNQGVVLALLRLFSFRVIVPLLLTLTVTLVNAALVFIKPQNVGVVVSIVSPGGVRPQPLRAGLHWIIPVLERDIHYPIYWQTYTMSSKPNEGAKVGNDAIRARTSDGQEVFLDISIILRIDQEQAVTVHIDWQERYMVDLVRPLIRGIVRTQVSQFTVREVNSAARKDLEALLDRLLREELQDKGFTVDRLLVRDITFSPEYALAVEHKQVALEGEEQKEHEAEQLRNLARGRADAIEIEARAQANALKLIADALAQDPNLVTYHYVDKLSPNIRAMLLPSNVPLMLPLSNLVNDPMMTPTLTATTGLTSTSSTLSALPDMESSVP